MPSIQLGIQGSSLCPLTTTCILFGTPGSRGMSLSESIECACARARAGLVWASQVRMISKLIQSLQECAVCPSSLCHRHRPRHASEPSRRCSPRIERMSRARCATLRLARSSASTWPTPARSPCSSSCCRQVARVPSVPRLSKYSLHGGAGCSLALVAARPMTVGAIPRGAAAETDRNRTSERPRHSARSCREWPLSEYLRAL